MEAAPVPTHKRCRTALALAHDPLHCQRLTVGCPVIDKCLGGGFRSTGVTEVGAEQPLLLNCHDFPGFAPLCLKDCRGRSGVAVARAVSDCRRKWCRKECALAACRGPQAQLPREAGGIDGPALYVSTEGPAPIKRLAGLAEAVKVSGNGGVICSLVLRHPGHACDANSRHRRHV